MSRFIDDRNAIVTDAIEGLLARDDGVPRTRLEGFPEIKVVLRADADPSRVAILSGGGSGHEPAHAGFVGRGMLTGAIVGEVFTSPSVDAVLAGILAVTGEAGCLLIVKNYTGDRLNFGLAAERAKQMGRSVEMVVVADDIALADAPQARGVAGTLFVHKVAGYLAEQGACLAEVKAAAEQVASSVRSLGVALATCDLPGQPPRSSSSTPELGLGIHGEPGTRTVDIASAREAVRLIAAPLSEAVDGGGGGLALLLNNLGGATPIEMDIVLRDLLETPLGHRARLLVGPAPLMTSLNMLGFSVSALPLSDDIEAALSAPVAPAAWPRMARPFSPSVRPLPEIGPREAFEAQADAGTEMLLRAVLDALVMAEASLNALDSHVGDGDTGTTVAEGARALRQMMDGPGLPLAEPARLLQAIGQTLATAMGGSSGVLLSILFTTAGNAAADGSQLAAALGQGARAMQHYGGAREGDRTMLDALLPALSLLQKTGALRAAAGAAREGAEATADMMRAQAGRSAYLRAESLAGHADPGAMAVALAFEAAADAASPAR